MKKTTAEQERRLVLDKRINANVALCKCPSSKGIYGVRFEERGNDWVRTWAFKIDEKKAKREGFDRTTMSGSMDATPEYPGCPYCGSMDIALCECEKIFCMPSVWKGWFKKLTCPWCEESNLYYRAKSIDIQGNSL